MTPSRWNRSFLDRSGSGAFLPSAGFWGFFADPDTTVLPSLSSRWTFIFLFVSSGVFPSSCLMKPLAGWMCPSSGPSTVQLLDRIFHLCVWTQNGCQRIEQRSWKNTIQIIFLHPSQPLVWDYFSKLTGGEFWVLLSHILNVGNNPIIHYPSHSFHIFLSFSPIRLIFQYFLAAQSHILTVLKACHESASDDSGTLTRKWSRWNVRHDGLPSLPIKALRDVFRQIMLNQEIPGR